MLRRCAGASVLSPKPHYSPLLPAHLLQSCTVLRKLDDLKAQWQQQRWRPLVAGGDSEGRQGSQRQQQLAPYAALRARTAALWEPIDDVSTMRIGKHKGSTYRHIYDQYPGYCKWAMQQALDGTTQPDLLRLCIYSLLRGAAQGAASVPPKIAEGEAGKLPVVGVSSAAEGGGSSSSSNSNGSSSDSSRSRGLPSKVCGPPGSINELTFVVTGTDNDGIWTRDRIEALITFFGGTVRKTMHPTVDFLLVAGDSLDDTFTKKKGRSVKESMKYRAAVEMSTPILTGMEKLIQLIEGGGPATLDEQEAQHNEAREGSMSKQKEICFDTSGVAAVAG